MSIDKASSSKWEYQWVTLLRELQEKLQEKSNSLIYIQLEIIFNVFHFLHKLYFYDKVLVRVPKKITLSTLNLKLKFKIGKYFN